MTRTKSRQRATSFDVAELAGVSQSTVSRALAGSNVITEETKERVFAAAAELNYAVDSRAARLRKGSTGTLAVVIICRPDESASDINPFYFSLLGSVCSAASAEGFETLVSFQSGEGNLFGRYEEQGQADGLIVIGTTSNHAAWDYFRDLGQQDRSVAYWGSPFEELDWVRSDNYEGGVIATRHLIETGHRKIVLLGTAQSAQLQFRERFEGYAETMADAGLDVRRIDVDEALDRLTQGRTAVAELLDSGDEFDAIFAVCDAIALGALEELQARGVAVPEDCSLIGFDGIKAGAHTTPPLTSIEPDFDVAGAMLVNAVRSDPSEVRSERRVPICLVKRGSVRRSAGQ